MDYDNTSNELDNTNNEFDLETTLGALSESAVNSKVYYGLSGLDSEGIARLAPIWETLTPEYRSKLLRELIETSESNFELNYSALGHFALDDEDEQVREAAIELLWEDETLALMHRLMEMVI